MKLTITAQNNEVRTFKGRHIDVRIEQGLLTVFNVHTGAILCMMQQTSLGEISTEGKPKPPKQSKNKSETVLCQLMSDLGKSKRDGDGFAQIFVQKLHEWMAEGQPTPSTQTLTINADTTAISALIGELVKLLSDDEADPRLVDGLLTGLGLDSIHDELASLRQQIDNLEASRDSQAQQIANIGHNINAWAEQYQHIVRFIGQENLDNPRSYVLCGIAPEQPAPIQPPAAAMPDPVAIDETTKFPGKRRVKADIQDDQRITPTEGSKSACSGCGRYNRHSVNCIFMDEGVQSEPCNEALGKPE
jgi:hypothetical protein